MTQPVAVSRCSGAFLIAVLLSACADNPPAPIEDRNQRGATGGDRGASAPVKPAASLKPGAPYRVRKGDTLYAIAFQYGMDFRLLATLNGITAPYTIFPGQELKTVAGAATTVNSHDTPSDRSRTASKVPPPSSSSRPAAVVTKAPVKNTAVKNRPRKSTTVTKSSPPAVKKSTGAAGPVSRWRWPTDGKVVRRFTANVHKGVDIAGRRGEPIRAVANGEVVYSGIGLKGYGALLIVKHNEQYLSAYGHNDALLVEEGDQVSAGQQIARMGSSGTDTVKLHFEIRRRGTPVDPLKLLPTRP